MENIQELINKYLSRHTTLIANRAQLCDSLTDDENHALDAQIRAVAEFARDLKSLLPEPVANETVYYSVCKEKTLLPKEPIAMHKYFNLSTNKPLTSLVIPVDVAEDFHTNAKKQVAKTYGLNINEIYIVTSSL